MAEVLRFQGTTASVPATGNPSGASSVSATFDETLVLQTSTKTQVTLTSDAPVAVPFGTLASASYASLRATGGKVVATVTTPDGTAQTVSVDPLLLLISESAPATALSLTRSPGVLTTVEVLLGQLAS